MAPTESYAAPARKLPEVAARDLLARKADELWTITPDKTVLDAIGEMADHRVGALLVADGESLCGIVSERDCLVRCVLVGKQAGATLVSEIMTEKVVTIGLDATMRGCMKLMTVRRVRHLPVIDEDRIVGMLSIGDLVREAIEQQSHVIDELERYVAGEPRLAAEGSPKW